MSEPTGHASAEPEASGPEATPSLPGTGTATERPSRPASGDSKEIPWRLIALGALLVYGILFVILNSKEVAVSFVFFTPHVSLIVALVLALLIGFLAGYLFDTVRERRRKAAGRAGTPPRP